MKKKTEIKKQKQTIKSVLKKESKTLRELAFELRLSYHPIPNRINQMVIDGEPVRVAGWHVLETTMIRIWGYGTEPYEPRPVRVKIDKPRPRLSVEVMECRPQEVKYRRDEMDEWLFRAKGMA